MNEDHFNFLANLHHIPQLNVGRNALNFGNQVQNIEVLPEQLNQMFNRGTLMELCGNPGISDLAAVVAILAWGGMRFDHSRLLLSNVNWPNVAPLIHQLRNGGFANRQQAYEAFREARSNRILAGLGISFFTKLICFLRPDLNGLILDQWTAKSINLLWGDHLVNLSKTGWVTDLNTSIIYEQFCTRVDHLAHELNIQLIDAEELIFSKGGRIPGTWRQYVRQNWVHAAL